MIDRDTAEQIVETLLDELIRGRPSVACPTWPHVLMQWDALSEQAQMEARRALVSLVCLTDDDVLPRPSRASHFS